MRIITLIMAGLLTLFIQRAHAQDTIRVIMAEEEPPAAVYHAGEDYFFSRKKEIGLDVTSLLAQLTPFNTVKAPNSLIGLKTKFYGRKYAFRMTFGFDIRDEEDLDPFLYFSIGYERRRILWQNFSYTNGWEGVLKVEGQDAIPFIGAANFYGLEYNISPAVFIGIEAQIRLGVQIDNGPEFRVLVPTAVFFNVRF